MDLSTVVHTTLGSEQKELAKRLLTFLAKQKIKTLEDLKSFTVENVEEVLKQFQDEGFVVKDRADLREQLSKYGKG